LSQYEYYLLLGYIEQRRGMYEMGVTIQCPLPPPKSQLQLHVVPAVFTNEDLMTESWRHKHYIWDWI